LGSASLTFNDLISLTIIFSLRFAKGFIATVLFLTP